ncbi:MAG: phosphate ABC transporter substrate-binding protein [Candidatus Riflebacteria bacterium]|nr:phosphate ABC transporter substrate-binding protein [Candidatus Riflebacteria bacterium]
MKNRPPISSRRSNTGIDNSVVKVLPLLVWLFFLCGCGSNSQNTLVIAGSTSVQPVIEKIAGMYKKQKPETKILVEGGGSSAGISAVTMGTAQIGMSSRELKKDDPKESSLESIVIAYDAIAIIVNPKNQLEDFSIETLRKIFSGEIKNWKDLGGDDKNINLIIREEGSGTRTAFEDMVMKISKTEEIKIDPFALVQDSTGGVQEVVRCDPAAIGFISMGAAKPIVKIVSIAGIKPDIESVKTKKYKLVRPFLFLRKGDFRKDASEFVDYVYSPDGQAVMAKEGLVGTAK